jgi:hypothetical protein
MTPNQAHTNASPAVSDKEVAMNIRVSTAIALTFALICFAAGAVAAGGYGHIRDGTVVGANAGWSWTKLSFTADETTGPTRVETDSQDAFGGMVRVAFAPQDRFIYGINLGGWRRSWGTNSVSLFYVEGAGTWFVAGEGLFLRGSAGFGSLDVTLRPIELAGNLVSFSNGGLNLGAGLGYEFRISPQFALGAAFDFHWINVGDIQGFQDVEAYNYLLSLNFNYYP